ncbi:MAG: S9 family peptidase [Bacteroidetes bacterium CG_4_10_14_3_um_filter_42_6]|nr:MAG: S9 family peptidase [Bacteroidetes bacterium CG_4_10_14_3_um_filter_42_6]
MKKTSLLIAGLFFILAISAQSTDTLKSISLDQIWKTYSFYPKGVHGINSLKNGKEFTMITKGTLVVYDYKTGDSVTTLINANDLVPVGDTTPIRLSEFTMNADETLFLIPTDEEAIYRHSSRASFYLYDSKSKHLEALSEGGKQQLADFSPQSDQVAFVRDNNLFVKNLLTGEEKQITTDGKHNAIINGTCDWVYEEEFGFTKAFFWSPDGKYIAYYRFDESRVKEYTLTNYGDLYPTQETYKYPKAGEDNSLVDIYIYELATGKAVKVDAGTETDQYIPRIKWSADATKLAVQRLNRLQNHLDILLADASTGATSVIYTEDNPYYIDITDDLTFTPDGKFFITSSEKSGYNHLYYYSLDRKLVKQLTSGNWDVTKMYGYDAVAQKVYFQSAERSPLDRDVCEVNLMGKIKVISTHIGTNSANFSSNFGYYINTWSDANTPPVYTVNQSDGKEVRVLEDNKALVDKLKGYKISPVEFFTFTSSDITLPSGEQVSLNAWRILPVNFNPDKKYPMLLSIYGGPGSQEVVNSWGGFNLMWYEMLAENGIMVISVDNRGTGARGEVFKKMTYKELGKYETLDYIETAKYMGTLPYVDKARIGIFGWSYGGFMASNALFQGADYFSTAIAVAPVTNWRYYDNIYTERFMQKPQNNASGYDNNSPINHVKELKGHYLLVHGGADDNVHPQNSMDLISALVAADKQFDLMIYPNKNHGIFGGNTRYHLFKKMTDVLYENLKGTE